MALFGIGGSYRGSFLLLLLTVPIFLKYILFTSANKIKSAISGAGPIFLISHFRLLATPAPARHPPRSNYDRTPFETIEMSTI